MNLKNQKKLVLKKVTIRDLQSVSGGLPYQEIIKKIAYPAEYLSIAAC
jgi:hypothetical protein